MVLVGAAVLSTFEGPNEQANCERAKEIFSDGIANTAAQLNVDLPEKLREDAFGGEYFKWFKIQATHFPYSTDFRWPKITVRRSIGLIMPNDG